MASAASAYGLQLKQEIDDLRAVADAGSGAAGDIYLRLLESVLLSAVTEFESFLEDLFFAVMCSKARPGGARPLVSVPDYATARMIVLRPQERYLTWLPIKESVQRAARFLEAGKPFSQLTARGLVTHRLSVLLAVRNAIAHKSPYALGEFTKVAGGKHGSPGAYLASTSGGATVCDALLADLARFGLAMCGSEAQCARLLGLADPLPAGKKVAAGAFRCDSCSTVYSLNEGEQLRCPICDQPCPTCGNTPSAARFVPV